jgi:hypothetical protein
MKGARRADGTTVLIPDVKGEWNEGVIYTNGITDYRGITYPPGYASPDPYGCRVLDNQMTNWLILVEAVARRYMPPPYNVRYFQVWNEFKGYHNPSLNRWDYENTAGDPSGYNAKHGYTYMYNQVYTRLKNVALSIGIPGESIKVGGPYLVMSSGSASNQVGGWPSNVTGPWGVMDRRPLNAVSYWLTNNIGAEFVVCDGGNRNKFGEEITDPFTRCEKFSAVNRWIRQQPGGQSLPIWWAEWYTSSNDEIDPEPFDFQAALGTWSAMEQIKSGGARTLLWGGESGSASKPPLWTSTTKSGGGQPTPWYFCYRDLGRYFGEGAFLYSATSSSTNIGVLASASHTLLVNRSTSQVTVVVEGVTTNLLPYGVAFVPVPHTAPAPRSPTGLRAEACSTASMRLAWADNSTNETGFQILRALEKGSFALRGEVAAGVTEYVDTNLALDTTYSYFVRATNLSGASAPSNIIRTRTMPFAFHEAEELAYSTSFGDTATPYQGEVLSKGKGNLFNGNAANDHVTFVVPVPKAGTYQVVIRATKNQNRGKFQLSVAPALGGDYASVGGVQDLYASTEQHIMLYTGLTTFTNGGDYYFRCKVTGKHGSSTGYKLGFDFIQLAPYSLEFTRRAQEGLIETTLTGPAVSRAILQKSTTLGTWTPVLTNEPFTGNLTVCEPGSNEPGARFYRIRLEP